MLPGLMLTLPLLVAAAGECFFVSNTRIVLLPSCNFSPAAMATLQAEEPAPTRDRRFERQQRTTAALRRMRAVSQRNARPFVDARRAQELERRLDTAERQRMASEARRLSAEQLRAAAIEQRDGALRELAVIRKELAAARAHIGQDRRAGLQ